MPPLFSVVTPCFNAVDVLPRCVGSIRGQKDVTVEHIIQDGFSKDQTAAWAARQPELIVHSEKDRGMYDAINKGWARSPGEILSWLNADEQYLPASLAHIAQVFRDNPDADIVYGNTIMVGPDGQPLAARREIPLRFAYVVNGFLHALSCSLFFHRRLLDEGFLTLDSGFRYAGDFDLILRLMKARRKFVQVRAYIGLFGIYGANLSVIANGKMDAEIRKIRQHYGGLPAPLRQAVMLGRYIERIVNGCYTSDTLTYDFALDEKPSYRRITNARTGYRFTYRRAYRQVQQNIPQ